MIEPYVNDPATTVNEALINKDGSDSVSRLIPGTKTPLPHEAISQQAFHGDVSLKILDDHGQIYASGTQVYLTINGVTEDYIIGENSTIIIPVSKLPNDKSQVSLTVLATNKSMSDALNFELLGKNDSLLAKLKLKLENEKNSYIDKINQINNLSETQKQTYIQALETLNQSEQQKLDVQTDQTLAQGIFDAVILDFETIYQNALLQSHKNDQINLIEQRALDLKKLIDGLDSLTTDEKIAHNAQILQTKNQANTNLEKETTAEGAEDKRILGIIKLENVFLKASQINAKNDLDKYLQKQLETVNNFTDMDEEKRESFITDMLDEVMKAKDAIGEADTQLSILTLSEDAKEKLDEQVLLAMKENAKAYIEDLVKEPRSAAIEALITGHQDEIDLQTDTLGVTSEKNRAQASIELQLLKEEQIELLKDYANTIEVDLNEKLRHLTDDEKAVYMTEIQRLTQDFSNQISSQTTTETVIAKREAGEEALSALLVSAAKQNAKNQLNDKKNDMIDKMNEMTGLTEDNLGQYLLSFNATEKEFESKIDGRTNLSTIDYERQNGFDAYEAILLEAKKTDRKNLLDKKVLELKELVKDLEILTPTQKQAYYDHFDTIVSNAKSQITDAHNDSVIEEIYQKALSDLNRQFRLAENENQDLFDTQM